MQRMLALMLALWLGGLGCLSGCALMSSTALAAAPHASAQLEQAAVPTVTVSAEGEHACCRLLKDEDEAAPKDVSPEKLFGQKPRTHQTMDCCPLARLSSDPARKPRVAAEQAAALPGTSAIFVAQPKISFVPRAVRVWRPPRSETYLLCCVFLI